MSKVQHQLHRSWLEVRVIGYHLFQADIGCRATREDVIELATSPRPAHQLQSVREHRPNPSSIRACRPSVLRWIPCRSSGLSRLLIGESSPAIKLIAIFRALNSPPPISVQKVDAPPPHLKQLSIRPLGRRLDLLARSICKASSHFGELCNDKMVRLDDVRFSLSTNIVAFEHYQELNDIEVFGYSRHMSLSKASMNNNNDVPRFEYYYRPCRPRTPA